MKVKTEDINLENEVISGCLNSKDTVIEVISNIKTQYVFYDKINQQIFKTIKELFQNGRLIDEKIIASQINSKGGDYDKWYKTIQEKRKLTHQAKNASEYANILNNYYVKRKIDEILSKYKDDNDKNENDIQKIIEGVQKELFSVTNDITNKEPKHIKQGTEELDKILKTQIENQGKLIGVTTGLTDIDKRTGGWQKTDLIVIAARPAMGKTAYMLEMARNAANKGNPIGIFSLEMGSTQLVARMASSMIKVPYADMLKGKMSKEYYESWKKAKEEINKLPIHIDDSGYITVQQLRAKVQKLVIESGIKVVYIDYMQLISSDDKNKSREQQVSDISRSLKLIAKDFDIPVVALSQLSRGVEHRTNKRPILADLRESGSIEQDATIVQFLYRPEEYGEKEYPNGESTKGIVEIITAKWRNGDPGFDKIIANIPYNKFYDINYGYEESQADFIPDKETPF